MAKRQFKFKRNEFELYLFFFSFFRLLYLHHAYFSPILLFIRAQKVRIQNKNGKMKRKKITSSCSSFFVGWLAGCLVGCSILKANFLVLHFLSGAAA